MASRPNVRRRSPEASVGDQDLVHAPAGRFDQGAHQVQRSVAALLAAAQHAGVLDAHRLAGETTDTAALGVIIPPGG